jgi:hypothetical protein
MDALETYGVFQLAVQGFQGTRSEIPPRDLDTVLLKNA